MRSVDGGTPSSKALCGSSFKVASGAKMLIEGERVPLADLEIVEIMRRRDLHRARALLGVGIGVGDDRDQASDERQLHALADEMPVALIVRMHGDRRCRRAWSPAAWSRR